MSDQLKLWLITQSEAQGYDVFDSGVVCAPTEEAARAIHPGGYYESPDLWKQAYCDWAKSPATVAAQYLGDAAPEIEAGAIICASFNAG